MHAHHRIELCREDGSALRTVMIDECTGAPHEFRGVYRGELLRVLQSAVPRERVHFGAPVQSVQQDDEGARHVVALVAAVMPAAELNAASAKPTALLHALQLSVMQRAERLQIHLVEAAVVTRRVLQQVPQWCWRTAMRCARRW